MGGALDSTARTLGEVNPITKELNKHLGIGQKKKKKGPQMPESQRKMLEARKAQPLLQQTALTPAEPSGGAGTALL